MKIISYLYLIILIPVFFSSCEKMDDISLSQTVFIEDPYYPGLPIYSEWGYNTFGAYIDRKPFISTEYELPVKIIVNPDTLHIIFRGRMDNMDVDLKLSIKGYSPATYYDLTELDNTTINLKETGRQAILKTTNETTILNLIEGELKFNRVQLLYVDEELTRTIVSGYFNLKTFLNDEPIAISYGRFDFGIGYENFYNY
ncbi:MAG: hypothetical protein JXJ22_18095 [Bacteroidales bacterium]|nr:hypothetical protein [Bacteroidales bacterium]